MRDVGNVRVRGSLLVWLDGREICADYYCFWMFLGYFGQCLKLGWEERDIPNSMAHIPVPVARSRTLWGFLIGAIFSLPSSIILKE